eukprot:m.17501 g.17501  ORF g.17501 m.17501 type:complete len:250 (+) comp8146_c1_seq1:3-752(+)
MFGEVEALASIDSRSLSPSLQETRRTIRKVQESTMELARKEWVVASEYVKHDKQQKYTADRARKAVKVLQRGGKFIDRVQGAASRLTTPPSHPSSPMKLSPSKSLSSSSSSSVDSLVSPTRRASQTPQTPPTSSTVVVMEDVEEFLDSLSLLSDDELGPEALSVINEITSSQSNQPHHQYHSHKMIDKVQSVIELDAVLFRIQQAATSTQKMSSAKQFVVVTLSQIRAQLADEAHENIATTKRRTSSRG